ncbi:hypothetical protein [Chelatococcus reniformis]|uniref:Uncharacterized protein n=1 Tax=Chelatococcus reniformis TaxID=1494448 RepID=A0A916UKX8_9HYPH|nr:hypothetical protein [Chelatococcus reniformis]GGC76969.1 hypothetical protein GCM10010994_39090 [Chelatococcus reniformis]
MGYSAFVSRIFAIAGAALGTLVWFILLLPARILLPRGARKGRGNAAQVAFSIALYLLVVGLLAGDYLRYGPQVASDPVRDEPGHSVVR